MQVYNKTIVIHSLEHKVDFGLPFAPEEVSIHNCYLKSHYAAGMSLFHIVWEDLGEIVMPFINWNSSNAATLFRGVEDLGNQKWHYHIHPDRKIVGQQTFRIIPRTPITPQTGVQLVPWEGYLSITFRFTRKKLSVI